MIINVDRMEKKLMNQDLDIIEDYLNKRFELERNELVTNMDAIEGRYKFNYSKGIDGLNEFMLFYNKLFSKLHLISIKSFMNTYNTILVELGRKHEISNQINQLQQ
ncbi:MAG: hypothetical protein NKF70_03995 [Methanobacterium sp. ERen5]|nr:MAG: hypothetical protein NKF70_03995 [Methanobacterium sp. ERen5]